MSGGLQNRLAIYLTDRETLDKQMKGGIPVNYFFLYIPAVLGVLGIACRDVITKVISGIISDGIMGLRKEQAGQKPQNSTIDIKIKVKVSIKIKADGRTSAFTSKYP
jgi:hypothetical protein